MPPVLGIDAKLDSGGKAVLDQSAAIYPLRHLAQLPAGEYHVQAVFGRKLERPDGRLEHDGLELRRRILKREIQVAAGRT